MGFFSKTCAKTHLPILHKDRGFDTLAQVVALKPDGTIARGLYDGYARVGDVCLADQWDKVKMVLEKHYAGETYDQLGKSGNELGQGHFMSNKFILHCLIQGQFKDYAAYKRAFKKHANW